MDEAGFPAYGDALRACGIEGVSELHQHCQRHKQAEGVAAAGIVDQGFDHNEGTANGQRIIGLFRPDLFSLQVPVVQDQAHRNDIRLRERTGKGIAGDCMDAAGLLRAPASAAAVCGKVPF